MSGIGCVLLILHVGFLVGHVASPEGVVATLKALPDYFGDPVGMRHCHCLLTPTRVAKSIPLSRLALSVATSLTHFSLPHALVIEKVPRGCPTPVMRDVNWEGLDLVLESAIVLAMMGAIGTLLTSLACDIMTRT